VDLQCRVLHSALVHRPFNPHGHTSLGLPSRGPTESGPFNHSNRIRNGTGTTNLRPADRQAPLLLGRSQGCSNWPMEHCLARAPQKSEVKPLDCTQGPPVSNGRTHCALVRHLRHSVRERKTPMRLRQVPAARIEPHTSSPLPLASDSGPNHTSRTFDKMIDNFPTDQGRFPAIC